MVKDFQIIQKLLKVLNIHLTFLNKSTSKSTYIHDLETCSLNKLLLLFVCVSTRNKKQKKEEELNK